MMMTVKPKMADKSISPPVEQSIRPISESVDQSSRRMEPQPRQETQPMVATGANAIAISSANPMVDWATCVAALCIFFFICF